MKAAIGNKHQVIIKIVKQLDSLMIRDPYEEVEKNTEEELEPFELPVPSCLMMEGISISGATPTPFSLGSGYDQEEETVEEPK